MTELQQHLWEFNSTRTIEIIHIYPALKNDSYLYPSCGDQQTNGLYKRRNTDSFHIQNFGGKEGRKEREDICPSGHMTEKGVSFSVTAELLNE